MKLGIAMVTSRLKMATVIISSMSVNPEDFFDSFITLNMEQTDHELPFRRKKKSHGPLFFRVARGAIACYDLCLRFYSHSHVLRQRITLLRLNSHYFCCGRLFGH